MTANILKMPAMREGAARRYRLGEVQSAEQVVNVMVFLLSDAASRLTGQIISVDGGFHYDLAFGALSLSQISHRKPPSRLRVQK